METYALFLSAQNATDKALSISRVPRRCSASGEWGSLGWRRHLLCFVASALAHFARPKKSSFFFVQNGPLLVGKMIPHPVAVLCTPLEASSGHILQKSIFCVFLIFPSKKQF